MPKVDIKNMEYVCSDEPADKSWYYDVNTRTYVKVFDGSNNYYASITGGNLPNPFALEDSKIAKRRELSPELKASYRVKCTKAVHTLWEHWNNQNKEA